MKITDAERSIGRRVTLFDRGRNLPVDRGLITAHSTQYVFVRYDGHQASMATRPGDLEFELPFKCPECKQDKCRNCTGGALDELTDKMVPCECTHDTVSSGNETGNGRVRD